MNPQSPLRRRMCYPVIPQGHEIAIILGSEQKSRLVQEMNKSLDQWHNKPKENIHPKANPKNTNGIESCNTRSSNLNHFSLQRKSRKNGSLCGIRTHTLGILSALSLPIGLRGQTKVKENGPRWRIRTSRLPSSFLMSVVYKTTRGITGIMYFSMAICT